MLGHISSSEGRIYHFAQKTRSASFMMLKAAKHFPGSGKIDNRGITRRR